MFKSVLLLLTMVTMACADTPPACDSATALDTIKQIHEAEWFADVAVQREFGVKNFPVPEFTYANTMTLSGTPEANECRADITIRFTLSAAAQAEPTFAQWDASKTLTKTFAYTTRTTDDGKGYVEAESIEIGTINLHMMGLGLFTP